MKNVTDTMNEQFGKAMDMQSSALEPMRVFAAVTADALEQVARKNYAIAGDVLEFSTKQAQLPLSNSNPVEVISAQVAGTNELVEQMKSRAAEYADLAQQFSDRVKQASESVSGSFK